MPTRQWKKDAANPIAVENHSVLRGGKRVNSSYFIDSFLHPIKSITVKIQPPPAGPMMPPPPPVEKSFQSIWQFQIINLLPPEVQDFALKLSLDDLKKFYQEYKDNAWAGGRMAWGIPDVTAALAPPNSFDYATDAIKRTELENKLQEAIKKRGAKLTNVQNQQKEWEMMWKAVCALIQDEKNLNFLLYTQDPNQKTPSILVYSNQEDGYWGTGLNDIGKNYYGLMLMHLRQLLLEKKEREKLDNKKLFESIKSAAFPTPAPASLDIFLDNHKITAHPVATFTPYKHEFVAALKQNGHQIFDPTKKPDLQQEPFRTAVENYCRDYNLAYTSDEARLSFITDAGSIELKEDKIRFKGDTVASFKAVIELALRIYSTTPCKVFTYFYPSEYYKDLCQQALTMVKNENPANAKIIDEMFQIKEKEKPKQQPQIPPPGYGYPGSGI